ncbi:tetratricopeptide repeat protein [Sulfitobacter sp. D35]|uniref:tetratricopeptide repeat protein n=1 Tax=Sulfitobacter sp. D35 TaxID=3083252 RepID=UPI00296EADAA|nr:tetratricopeptide repeat protein [Sulfitobacter sp. D35]MDW4496985.1 tetratricopeptide repeat protein [Sulfitobacter sp. D35]
MGTPSFNLKSIVAALFALALNSLPLAADERVDELLGILQSAPEQEALRAARDLEIVWSRSGSAAMDLLLERGRDALEEEDPVTAIEHLTALTDHAPDFAEGYHARATAYFQRGLYGPALDDLQRTLALNPSQFNAIFGLGVMLEEFGDLRRAEQAFRQVLALHPHHQNAKTALEALESRGVGRAL